jgi:uncharacterized protein (TIGR03437 family)
MKPDGTFTYITSSTPVIRGQLISLFANGLGPVKSRPADGAAAGAPTDTTTPCTVTIGGQPVTPQFCGFTQYIFYQIDAQVPANLSPGNQPITISVGGKTSPTGIVIPVE